LFNYIPGGFHPVAIGDLLGEEGRYRVAHKLGHGGYATVWLCHDKISKKWRAVKIMAAELSKPDCADLRALKLFEGIDRDVLTANHIQLDLEHFWIKGPNGRHLSFVLPLLGANLSDTYDVYGHVPELMKDICFQLVEAMKFMHSHSLCHGDFRDDNIMFRLVDGVDEWEEDALMNLLGQPFLVPVRPVDETETELEPGVPAYLVTRTHINYGSGICASEIAVIDFGVSYHVSKPPIGKGTGIPMPYAAPEELLEQDQFLGFGTDIWALGVTITKVRLGYTPFACDTDDLLKGVEKLECIIAPMPNPYRTAWKEWNYSFVNCLDAEGQMRDDDSWKDETVFATIDALDEEEVQRDRVEEIGVGNYLEYRMNRTLIMCIDDKEAADIAAQAESNPRRLPSFKPTSEENPPPEYEDVVKYKMDKPEIKQMFDLLLSIFKWQPDQRASLDDILDHDWFGQRNRHLASPPRSLNRRRSPRRKFKRSKRNRKGPSGSSSEDNTAAVVSGNDRGRV
jgi:serine/threonine protein kinase